MTIEKQPLNPVPKGYIPPNSVPYKVKDGDTWETIAREQGVKVADLVYANFKTGDFAEVNWYLNNYVGCRLKTHDGKNWRFSRQADPGIIYIPKMVVVMPPITIEGHAPSRWDQAWAGLAKSHSGDLFVIGAHDLTGKVYNLGNSDGSRVKNAIINVNGYKFGLGLGASVSAVFVMAWGYTNANEMAGVSGSWDFDIAIGEKLGDFLKDVKGLGHAVDTLEKFKKLRYVSENAVKNLGITTPGIYSIPIPFAGIGLHLWGGYKFGDVSVFSSGLGVP